MTYVPPSPGEILDAWYRGVNSSEEPGEPAVRMGNEFVGRLVMERNPQSGFAAPDLSNVSTTDILRELHDNARELDAVAEKMAELANRAESLARTQHFGMTAIRTRLTSIPA